MFNAIEKYRPVFKVLLALIALSFVTFGVQSFSSGSDNYIAKVGDAKIATRDVTEFARTYGVSPEGAYGMLVQQAYLDQGAERIDGFNVDLATIKTIEMNSDKFKTDGKFDPNKYHGYVANTTGSEKRYLEQTKTVYSSILYSDVAFGGVGPVVSVPRMRMAAAATSALKDASWKIYRASDYKTKVGVTEEGLKEHYQAHKEDYRIPEAVKVEYVSIGLEDVAKIQKVSDEEIETAIAQAKEAQKAKADGDKKAEGAADAKDGLVQGVPSKEEVAEELKMQKARKVFSAVEEDVAEQTFNNPKDLLKVAEKYGVEVRKIGDDWLFKDSPFEQLGLTKAMGDELFGDEALQGNNTNVFNDGKSLRVFRNYEVRQTSYKPFEEVKAEVENDFLKRRSLELIQADAKAAMESLKNGKDPFDKWESGGALGEEELADKFDRKTADDIMEIFPTKDEPGYVLGRTKDGEVAIVKVVGFKLGNFGDYAQRKAFVSSWQQNAIIEFMMPYIHYLKTRIPFKQGREKLEEA